MWKRTSKALSFLIAAALLCVSMFTVQSMPEASQEVEIAVTQDELLDIVLTLGQSDTDVSDVSADLTAALVERGVPLSRIRLQAVEANEVSAGDTTSGWEIYDHTNFIDQEIAYYRPYYNDPYAGQIYAVGYEPQWNVANHIQVDIVEGVTNIDFRGYGVPAYKDFMYMPNTESGKKRLEFTIQEGYFYDALNGAGFLFNTSLSDAADHANRTMSGYLLFFRYGASVIPTIELYKFTNIDVNAFHNSASTLIENYAGFTRLAWNTSPGVETTRVVKIEATASQVKMWYNNTAVNWSLTGGGASETVVLDTDFGAYGFGPMTSYSSHSCARPTLFSFLDVRMSTESTKRFSEVIRQPEWRDESKRFIINVEDGAVPDFSDPVALGEILSRLGNESIHYLGWGRDELDGQAFIAKNDNRGVFVDKDAVVTYDAQVDALADYIYNVYYSSVINDAEYLIYGKPSSMAITPESARTNTIDGDWPQGKWRVIHTHDFYENPTGSVPYDGLYLNNLDSSFTEAGKYDIYYKDTLAKTVFVHRKSVAVFVVTVDGEYIVSVISSSHDPDFESGPSNGIASSNWWYRETDSAVWTAGQPTVFEADKNYIIKLVVTDNYGTESEPYYKYVSTSTGAPADPISEFRVIPGNLLTHISETVSYQDTSYDPQGLEITERLWKVFLGAAEIYTGAVPMTDFSGEDAGTYRITLAVKNSSNVWSQTAARYLTVVRDATAPTAQANIAPATYTTVKTVSITFTDEEGGSGFSHRYAVVTTNEDEIVDWGSMGTNSVYSVQLATIGTKYVHYKVYDYAGNSRTGFFGPYVFVDETPPVITEFTVDPAETEAGWVNSEATVTVTEAVDDFTATENIIFEVSEDGVEYVSGNSLARNTEGIHSLWFKTTDESNNSSVTEYILRIDLTAPTAPEIDITTGGEAYAEGEWATDTVDFVLSGSSDEGGSGLRGYQYKLNDGEWQDGSTYSFNTSGEYTLYYRSIDNAGNVSETGTKSVKLVGAINASVKIGGEIEYLGNTDARLYIEGRDGRGGITEMMVSNYSDFHDADWEPYATFKMFSLLPVSGTKTVYVKVKDAFDNVSPTASDTVVLDTDKPYFQLSVIEPDKTSTEVKYISVNCIDEHSGISYIKFVKGFADSTHFGYFGERLESDTVAVYENGYYTFFAVDTVGNMCVGSIEVTQLRTPALPGESGEESDDEQTDPEQDGESEPQPETVVEYTETWLRYNIKKGTILDPYMIFRLFDSAGSMVDAGGIISVSSDPNIIYLGEDGMLAAVNAGNALITITDKVSGMEIVLRINVENMDRIADTGFSDIRAGYWAGYHIEHLSGIRVLRGIGSNTFRPEDNISFKEFLMAYDRLMLFREPGPYIMRRGYGITLSDTDWAYYGVADMLNLLDASQFDLLIGNIDSYSAVITRGQAAYIMSIIEKLPVYSGDDLFGDISENIYSNSINATAYANIFKGYAPGLFGPDRPITRAETAAIFSRLLEK